MTLPVILPPISTAFDFPRQQRLHSGTLGSNNAASRWLGHWQDASVPAQPSPQSIGFCPAIWERVTFSPPDYCSLPWTAMRAAPVGRTSACAAPAHGTGPKMSRHPWPASSARIRPPELPCCALLIRTSSGWVSLEERPSGLPLQGFRPPCMGQTAVSLTRSSARPSIGVGAQRPVRADAACDFALARLQLPACRQFAVTKWISPAPRPQVVMHHGCHEC